MSQKNNSHHHFTWIHFKFIGGSLLEISELQQLMRDLYYHRDAERGPYKTFLWLVSEMGELANALRKDDRPDHLDEEFADVLAWTASLANLLNINLDHAVNKKYPGICLKCNAIPCKCSF